MRFRILLILVWIAPAFLVHATPTLDPSWAISTLNLLISQYETKIKQLESENAVLRNEMVKAGIKIPLSEYSGAVVTEAPATPSISIVLPQGQTGSSQTGGTSSGGVYPSTVLVPSLDQYGKDVVEFVKKIQMDWNSIKQFYKFNSGAKIAWYEFVQSGANDHVFVDIVIGSGTSGVYDIKVLYQFEKKEYKRRLIGIFDYNPTFWKYVTRPGGSNPFAGVARTFVKDPNYAWAVTIPATVWATNTGSNTPSSDTATSGTPVTTTPSPTATAEIADILKAYSEKKYLSTISLSTTYLEKNPPTIEVLNVRYRTYFIIGKFTESLTELSKIEKLGWLDRQTACNAQVIATYSKNQALIDKYSNICKK